ncbi:phosphotransferase RcsD [Brenneria goodwinii]|uniref:phosphotransferase RcsD n=1 Tax=Brenneria goodwinii TaxID=1109412 RepID=UPI000EF24E07|nr:phosphotransferase RcsD [Brenneria goodwinii]MCG8159110.1 phosphotransferase RcsD [Brenneria goodwinii]MCG8161567.1 phosphotransferase RcsD [Brenneria goodwinii]MCG8165544.1 phosphotransferase RcsD [Brenneria goodwinii]MCG8170032.1 phosphotransferase RcsD [Brenneria goodwinii]MCG8174241.1 phosphotransferase RcsD [Brenneria goodwinii]
MPAIIMRYFSLFIILLLLTTGTFSYNYLCNWLMNKKHALTDVAQGVQKRIDTYRFFTYQIYGSLNGDPLANDTNINAISLMPDVFYVEKSDQKTDALIFGQHDESTLNSVYRISRYLDILWGAENDVYTMYYLNGIDNSLTMISTQTLKDISSQFRGSYITAIAEARRTEMLQQANALDERESFSPIRKLRFYNNYYFTLRTTFNQPGHLATIIAFDLPINDLIPLDMSRENFVLRQDTSASIDANSGNEDISVAQLNGSLIEISSQLINAPVKIVFQVPIRVLVLNMLNNNIWLLLLNLALLLFALSGFYIFRRKYIQPNEDVSQQLADQLDIYDETISRIPMGVLIYDFSSNKVVIQNALSESLLPHLSLQKITNMADEHQGIVQVTVNNEMYEIRQFRSQYSPDYCLFLLREQDKEILVNKKLQLAQREYEKNVQARKRLFKNLLNEIKQPLFSLRQHLFAINRTEDIAEQQRIIQQLLTNAGCVIELLENIELQEKLERQEWLPAQQSFSPLIMIDNLLLELLPRINQKGLSLFNHYNLDINQTYLGDSELLRKTLSLLLNYAIINTDYGKITISTDRDTNDPGKLIIQISDTGAEITGDGQDNLDYPFLHPATSDRFSQNSGLTIFLCNQLCNKLGGRLNIHSKAGLGTHYILAIAMEPEALPVEEEKLLDDITVLLDITSDEVRNIVSRLLTGWGADYQLIDERQVNQQADLCITDDPEKNEEYSILLSGDAAALISLEPHRLQANYNISQQLLEALLKLIEQRLETPADTPLIGDSKDTGLYAKQLASSDYYSLFVETVPDDLKRLYTEAEDGDFLSLAQTAHRLKGVFAMLNLHPGKQLCEQLEQHITARDSVQIENNLHEIEGFVSALLQQGSQHMSNQNDE